MTRRPTSFSKEETCRRLQITLDANHAVDIASFGPGYSTTDHMYAFQQPRQVAAEWHQTLWAAAIDFKQAVDTVRHSSIWRALREQSIERAIHADARGAVMNTDDHHACRPHHDHSSARLTTTKLHENKIISNATSRSRNTTRLQCKG